MNTPEERMLNAYKGIESDCIPCAPEFWNYYPAKLMGISMIEYQREIPHWVGLLESFRKFKCEGWGITSPVEKNPHVKIKSKLKKIDDELYTEFQDIILKDITLSRIVSFHKEHPSWIEKYPVDDYDNVLHYFNSYINDDIEFDLKNSVNTYNQLAGQFLLEINLGYSFFDFFKQILGFEGAIFYFFEEEELILKEMADKYLIFKKRLVEKITNETTFKAAFITCDSSCTALLGANLWRKWDKPYEKAIVDHCHKLGLLVHHHNHGPVMNILADMVEVGFDCICPFERPPGDVIGIEGIKKVRTILQDKTTFNGNIHTVKALIQGTTEDVRKQVREVKEAFKGSNRVIIGSGDQIGPGTPDENLWAMVEEARKKD